MKDQNKTKQQLLNELIELRQAHDELERRLQGHTAELASANAALRAELSACRRAEETLRTNEARYRTIVEDLPALICRFLPDGILSFVNDHYCEYFHQREEDLLGHDFFQFIPNDERDSVRRHFGALTPDRPAVTYEHQVVGPDGTLRWQRWTDRALFDERGEPIEYQSIGEDVTERKLADEALARSEERFEQVTDCAGVWVWEVDAEGLYTYVSPMEETILGYKAEEVIGKKHFYDFFAPDTKAALTKVALDIFSQKVPFRDLENSNVHKDGHVVFLETSGTPVLDEHGNLLGYRGADRDVSERKRAEQALRESEERFRTLAETTSAVIVLYDAERLHYANAAAQRLTGYTQAELLQKNFMEIVAWLKTRSQSV